jgi:hypothetical protein
VAAVSGLAKPPPAVFMLRPIKGYAKPVFVDKHVILQ